MKTKIVTTILFVAIILASCVQSNKIVLPTETTISTTTFISVSPIPTATWWMIPRITATPISATTNTDYEMAQLITQLFHVSCVGSNLANIKTPSPEDLPQELKFIEVDVQPDAKATWISEIADNIDKSRQAFIACKPEELCRENHVYVKDNKTTQVYEIDWGGMTRRPTESLKWINNDILLFAQSASPHYERIVAVNFDKKEYQYYALATDEYKCEQPTPTP